MGGRADAGVPQGRTGGRSRAGELLERQGTGESYFDEIRVFKAGGSVLGYVSME